MSTISIPCQPKPIEDKLTEANNKIKSIYFKLKTISIDSPSTHCKFEYPMLSDFIKDLQSILDTNGDAPISMNCPNEWSDEIVSVKYDKEAKMYVLQESD